MARPKPLELCRGIVELALSDVFSVLYVRRVYRRTLRVLSLVEACMRQGASEQTECRNLVDWTREVRGEARHFEEGTAIYGKAELPRALSMADLTPQPIESPAPSF